MLRTGSFVTAACLLAAAGSATWAAEPTVQKFEDWTVTIQPGQRGISPRDPVSRTVTSNVKLVSQTETQPLGDAEIPPPPAENSVAEAAPVASEPGADGAALPSVSAPCPTTHSPELVRMYSQVYNAIPFSRAEYEANPSYRHDATMEFLFGQMRPTVIHRGETAAPYANPMTSFYPYALGYSYGGYNTYYNPIFSTPYASPYYYGVYRPYSLW